MCRPRPCGGGGLEHLFYLYYTTLFDKSRGVFATFFRFICLFFGEGGRGSGGEAGAAGRSRRGAVRTLPVHRQGRDAAALRPIIAERVEKIPGPLKRATRGFSDTLYRSEDLTKDELCAKIGWNSGREYACARVERPDHPQPHRDGSSAPYCEPCAAAGRLTRDPK